MTSNIQNQTNDIQIRWKPEITTPQLILRPIEEGDLVSYEELFANKVAMQKYLGGPRNIKDRFFRWIKRWDIHPYSALAVVDRVSKQVIGHMVLGHGDWEGDRANGWSEVAIVIHPNYWNYLKSNLKNDVGSAFKHHMGTEAIRAAVAYAKVLRERLEGVPCDVTEDQRAEVEEIAKNDSSFEVHRNEEGQIDWVYLPLNEIRATAAHVNVAGHKILEKVFIEENEGTMKKKNPERDLFTIKLS